MSSTHSLSRAQRHASLVSAHASHHSLLTSSFLPLALFGSLGGSSQPLAPITGCGAAGTIADKSGFEDADGNLTIENGPACTDWNSFKTGFPAAWLGTAPYQHATTTSGGFTFFGVTDAVNSRDRHELRRRREAGRQLSSDGTRQRQQQDRHRPHLPRRVDRPRDQARLPRPRLGARPAEQHFF